MKEKERFILGIDDAGRGPVIGSMFLAGVLMNKEQEEFLKNEGVKDSKMLTHPSRVRLSKIIRDNSVAHAVVEATPDEIDKAVETNSLNVLEAQKMAEVVNILNHGKEKIEVIVDCPSTNREAWAQKLKGFIENLDNLSIRCEHKADVNHPSVSAASIIAKVSREEHVKGIANRIKMAFGSGYPADPKTKEFLAKDGHRFEDDGIIRKSWGTWKELSKKEKQNKLF